MRVILYPSQDTTLYSETPTKNTGLDEILEVGKGDGGSASMRSLIQFDLADISASMIAGNIPGNARFDLVVRHAYAESLKNNQYIEIGYLTSSWEEGTGRLIQDIVQDTDGATWNTLDSSTDWQVSGSDFVLFDQKKISKPIADLTFDVTTQVRAWLTGTIVNHGFILKFPSSDEANTSNVGIIKFFSKDSNTVYKPTLVVKWDDQAYSTGTLGRYPSTDLYVAPSTLNPTYQLDETVRVNLAVRPRTPLKTFASASTQYAGQKYLPTSSYFSIIDAQTNLVIVPADDYSKISCDSNGSYFKFKIQNMYPLRFYRVRIVVEHDGLKEIFDDGYVFKVTQ
jgi:hypothetical protein